MGATGDVALVVVTWNSMAHLPSLAGSLGPGLAGVPRWRLVVVDNASTDGTPEWVRAHLPGAVLVETGRNAGYAAGVNAGVAAAGAADAVVVLNPDVVLDPGCIALLVRALDAPGVGVSVPRQLDAEGALRFSLRREPTVRRALGEAVLGGIRAGRRAAWGEMVTDPGAYDSERDVDLATGSALAISGETLEAVGPWDESFFLYSEETDYARRVRSTGRTIRFEPTAVVRHATSESATSPRLRALMVANRAALFDRTAGTGRRLAFRTALVAGELVRATAGRAASGAGASLLLRGEGARRQHLLRLQADAAPPPGGRSWSGPLSVVVPAHDEAGVLPRLLTALTTGPGSEGLEVVVVCNGCTDATAEVTRRGFPEVTVLETPLPSKNAALDLGDQRATYYPRAYVDADVVVTAGDLRRLAGAVLEPGVHAAAPELHLELDGATWPVRAYHRVWSRLPAVRSGLYGRGVVVVDEVAATRVDARHGVGDDLALHHAFADSERRVVPGTTSRVWVPRRSRDLVRRRARAAFGNSELARSRPHTDTTRTSAREVLVGAACRPRSWPDVAVFVTLTASARFAARRLATAGDTPAWLRDDSSRIAARA